MQYSIPIYGNYTTLISFLHLLHLKQVKALPNMVIADVIYAASQSSYCCKITNKIVFFMLSSPSQISLYHYLSLSLSFSLTVNMYTPLGDRRPHLCLENPAHCPEMAGSSRLPASKYPSGKRQARYTCPKE